MPCETRIEVIYLFASIVNGRSHDRQLNFICLEKIDEINKNINKIFNRVYPHAVFYKRTPRRFLMDQTTTNILSIKSKYQIGNNIPVTVYIGGVPRFGKYDKNYTSLLLRNP